MKTHGSTGTLAADTARMVKRVTSFSVTPPILDTAGGALYEKQQAWKEYGQKKLELRSQELLARCEQDCTFAPKINKPTDSRRGTHTTGHDDLQSRSEHSDSSSQSQYSASLSPQSHHGHERVATYFPTESQEISIHSYLARQERAREEAQNALHKLESTQPRKDFTRVTSTRPFSLSVTNRKPRSSSASPTSRQRSKPKQRPYSPKSMKLKAKSLIGTKRNGKESCRSDEVEEGEGSSLTDESVSPTPTMIDTMGSLTWNRERAALVSIIEAQQCELERREKAHHEAQRIASEFSNTIQAFEERLIVMESRHGEQLHQIHQLLMNQANATEHILHSLGINIPTGETRHSHIGEQQY